MIDYKKVIKAGLERLEQKNYESWSMLIKLCFDNPVKISPRSPRSIGQKKLQGDESNVNPVELMRFHPVLNKFEISTVKMLLGEAKLVKLQPNTLLYGRKDPDAFWYVILFGAVILHHEQLGALGVLTMEQTAGEECIMGSKR